nr:MAG TPA: hypothetical protein [Caudoviricetes sp.]
MGGGLRDHHKGGGLSRVVLGSLPCEERSCH